MQKNTKVCDKKGTKSNKYFCKKKLIDRQKLAPKNLSK